MQQAPDDDGRHGAGRRAAVMAAGAGAAAQLFDGTGDLLSVLVGTLFTMFVVPMFYTFIARKDRASRGNRQESGMAQPSLTRFRSVARP